ncbi:hypothetical protein ACWZEH_06925 [Streptomyces sp. QTS137]
MSDSQQVAGKPDSPPSAGNTVGRFLRISARGSTVGREIRGGFATLFTMACVLVLDPLIPGSAKGRSGEQPDPVRLTIATALVTAVMPFTCSITNGIGAGPVAHALLQPVPGRAKEIHWLPGEGGPRHCSRCSSRSTRSSRSRAWGRTQDRTGLRGR